LEKKLLDRSRVKRKKRKRGVHLTLGRCGEKKIGRGGGGGYSGGTYVLQVKGGEGCSVPRGERKKIARLPSSMTSKKKKKGKVRKGVYLERPIVSGSNRLPSISREGLQRGGNWGESSLQRGGLTIISTKNLGEKKTSQGWELPILSESGRAASY